MKVSFVVLDESGRVTGSGVTDDIAFQDMKARRRLWQLDMPITVGHPTDYVLVRNKLVHRPEVRPAPQPNLPNPSTVDFVDPLELFRALVARDDGDEAPWRAMKLRFQERPSRILGTRKLSSKRTKKK